MSMSLQWVGDCDGVVVFRDARGVREIDRPGDAVLAIQELLKEGASGVGALTAYAVCLSTRRVSEGSFVRQILDKSFPFIAGADPASRVVHDVVTRLRTLVAESELDGAELRLRILEEARAIHLEEKL